jgi:SAM-dependent methyltransferase
VNRKAHWENVYHTRSPLDVSWYQREPALSLALIEASGVASDGGIIDVGGGASVLVDRLLESGYSGLAVLDISGAALAHARTRLGARAAEVEWVEADVTTFRSERRFGLWHDRAVFHFLTDAGDRAAYVQTLEAALAPAGHVIIATFAPGGPTMCSGLDIVQYDADKLCGELGAGFELVEQRSELHHTPADKDQAFNFFLLRRV